MNRKLVIWGAGERGKRLYRHIETHVDAFIDLDIKKQGSCIDDKPIIDYAEYEKDYNSDFNVISYSHEKEVVDFLVTHNNPRYFLMTNLPGEFQESFIRNNLDEYLDSILTQDKSFVIQGFDLYAFLVNEKHKSI